MSTIATRPAIPIGTACRQHGTQDKSAQEATSAEGWQSLAGALEENRLCEFDLGSADCTKARCSAKSTQQL